MNISDIRIRHTFDKSKLKAIVSVTFDEILAIHDIKVIQGPERLFVAMPNTRDARGVYRDIAHPITADFRRELEQRVVQEYERHLEQQAVIKQQSQNREQGSEAELEPQQALEAPGLG